MKDQEAQMDIFSIFTLLEGLAFFIYGMNQNTWRNFPRENGGIG